MMRRSRIKAMATVPVRRKPTKDVNDEKSDLSNLISDDDIKDEKPDLSDLISSDNEQMTETPVACADDSKETLTETVNLLTIKREIEIESEQLSSIPQTVDVVKRNDNQELDMSLESSEITIKEEPVVQYSEQMENIIEQSSDLCEQLLENDNAPGSDETKGFFCLDTNVLTNHIGNNSVSSMESPGEPPSERVSANLRSSVRTAGGVGTSQGRNVTSLTARQKQKPNVSESAQKLGEAQRKFLLTHEQERSDRAKLTMYDLIYHNPVTNRMKKMDTPLSTAQRNSSSVSTPTMEEDEEQENCETSEAMPVPQVHGEPNDNLVLDEKITKDNNGSGFYKKRYKMKCWTKWETRKFYKALNTVGTDFLLMQSLFPQRTRQQIKMKFKREEKSNRRLVDKALFDQEFDIDWLKEDLDDNTLFGESDNEQSKEVKSEKSVAHLATRAKQKKIESTEMVALGDAESNEEMEESSVEESSDMEIYQIKATRSGRKPKVRKLQA